MEFVLVSLVALGIVFLMLLALIIRILYKRHHNKLEHYYVDKNKDGLTVLEEAEKIIQEYEKAVEDKDKYYG